MKNILNIALTTIFSLLFITVVFTIAELNIVAKTEFTNQLQQSVVMSASYLMVCKLIIQIVLTYCTGNILYHRIKDAHDKIINHNKARASWENTAGNKPITPEEAFSGTITKEDYKFAREVLDDHDVYDKVNTLQFDPIDQIDEIDKSNNCIDLRREGVYLSELLKGVKKTMHTFKPHHIKDNKRWKEVEFGNTIDVRSDYEVIVKNKKNHYYVEVD